MREPAISIAALRRAVERGVLSSAQLDLLLADPEQTVTAESPTEAPEAFNAITIAYYLGAFVVLFGFGWFLVDRWKALGAGGILVVALIYTTLFLGTAYLLRRQRFAIAAAFATLLAVGMTPLITWSLLELSGVWPERAPGLCAWDAPWLFDCRGKWMVIELTTILASLVALRTVRYAVLMKPIAISLLVLTFHLTESLFGYTFQMNAAGWAVVAAASFILLLAYAVDRRNDTDQDYAFWLYLPGLVAAFAGMQMVWSFDHSLRHVLILIAIAAMAIAVYLRRLLFLAFGAICFVWYLGYLAFDVFEGVVALPIILATVGLLVILGAVWAQRNYPRLVERVRETSGGERVMPGGYLVFAAPALLALLMIPLAAPRDRELLAQQRHHNRMWATRAARERRAARPPAPDSMRKMDESARRPDQRR